MTKSKSDETSQTQLGKFKEAAKEVETDNSEAAFNNVLKRIAKEPVAQPNTPKRK